MITIDDTVRAVYFSAFSRRADFLAVVLADGAGFVVRTRMRFHGARRSADPFMNDDSKRWFDQAFTTPLADVLGCRLRQTTRARARRNKGRFLMDFIFYTLDGRRPVGTHDAGAWQEWLRTSRTRCVGWTETPGGLVSTCFLGIAYQRIGAPGARSPLLLFETYVMTGPRAEDFERYATYDEAEAGHARWVAALTPS